MEGFSGTFPEIIVSYFTIFTVKDTRTKPRGRVEAREGGGFGWGPGEWWKDNTDNYN